MQVDPAVELVLLLIKFHHASPGLGAKRFQLQTFRCDLNIGHRRIFRHRPDWRNRLTQRGHDEYQDIAPEPRAGRFLKSMSLGRDRVIGVVSAARM
jgi:hypothetical protein